MTQTRTGPISYLATTLTSGTVLLKITFTSPAGGLDLSGATSGRVRHVHPVNGIEFWDLTLVGTPTARQAVMTHAMVMGDIDSTEAGTDVELHGLPTVSGTEYMAGPYSFLLQVVA